MIADAVLRQPHALGTSFPSSHTAVALATVIALAPFLPRGLAVPAIVYAVLVGWSRIYLGVHYPLDVIAGAGIGMVVGAVALLAVGRGPRIQNLIRAHRRMVALIRPVTVTIPA